MTTPRRTPQDALKAAGASTEAATRLLERVAARLGGRAAVSAVFGEPVVREDVTVIPVASARFGFGGGATQEDGDGRSNEGGGGGGGATARPLGFIEISKGTAVYRPIRPPWADTVIPVALLLAAVAAPRAARALAELGRRGV
ncbi:spore germination protein GerW family protein [Streptomyces sp. BE308]|uniref:GerW family sporulation protein n=1 Tax=unclassified Streptomyces TaxID=2593676 RepID=UPI002DDB5E15|nr:MULTISPECIES: spore germination protein GerW family protein [unclassified Streptomyces]MEE1795579.1 spore germination protein GerW family protein [Streptomyces sp. BE308]WRZ70673.1 spore germination protein GerW family protein [Streptomyces sp. NBC_01237]